MSGRQYNETFGKIHFWMNFIGVNLTFFPQVPRARRHAAADQPITPTRSPGSLSIGSFISFASTLFFIFIVFHTLMYQAGSAANY